PGRLYLTLSPPPGNPLSRSPFLPPRRKRAAPRGGGAPDEESVRELPALQVEEGWESSDDGGDGDAGGGAVASPASPASPGPSVPPLRVPAASPELALKVLSISARGQLPVHGAYRDGAKLASTMGGRGPKAREGKAREEAAREEAAREEDPAADRADAASHVDAASRIGTSPITVPAPAPPARPSPARPARGSPPPKRPFCNYRKFRRMEKGHPPGDW
ncbi:hypothetical protein TeGR_g630, partial [Tetraparma gracilis]